MSCRGQAKRTFNEVKAVLALRLEVLVSHGLAYHNLRDQWQSWAGGYVFALFFNNLISEETKEEAKAYIKEVAVEIK